MIRRCLTLLPPLAIVLLLAGCGSESPPATDNDPDLAAADAPHPGQAPYEAKCAACHDKAVYKAPSRTFLAMLGARNVYAAMDEGLMRAQAAGLNDAQKQAVAEYLTGQTLAESDVVTEAPACEDSPFDENIAPVSLGWGVDPGQTRFQGSESGGIDRSNVADLEVKWAFAFPNAIQARSQPAYGGGAVYFGSQDGTVRALDARTGCLRWSFRAGGEVRNAIVLSPWDAGELEAPPTLYFGDIVGRVYALDARTGELRWDRKVTEHPDGTLTGAAALHEGLLYVPLSSLEVVSAVNPAYECCTFRGAVVALNAATGEEIWRAHTIPEPPSKVGVTRAGTDILAPSGAPVWNSPAIDAARGLFYVGTGENYSSPADGNSDAIIAFDLKTGEKRWVSQQTAGDAWNAACLSDYTSDDANCPEENGPDYDFGASPMLVTLDDGRDIVVGGQKSGQVVGLDPETGKVLWKNQVGRGGVQGGVHFGMAAEGSRLYIPINDMIYPEDAARYGAARPPKPGLYALDAATGELLWSAPAADLCGDLEGCDPGISHAIKAVPGAVIAGYLDGRLRVHDGETGEVIWEMNTLQEYKTVSGEVARGGSFSGGGAIVADGMVYLNSGYGLYGHMPGNVFLALGPRDPESPEPGP
ncbi:MAG: PQQ-binding-like beta-propeller repeat protein [Xanthomonadales bacterium]|jgi:polyvinyl alcohol dehydrogenase (cytochrome)|nr:PQQ-binding-like beta-propeller repeat protein [Xanthomonadales bacterium]